MQKYLILIFLFISFIGLSQVLMAKTELTEQDKALIEQFKKDKTPLLIDVRTADEFKDVHVRGATHVPLALFEQKIADISKMAKGNKKHPIIIYCRSGKRAEKAKKQLNDQGFTNVHNIGGYENWPYKKDLIHLNQ